MTEQELVDGVLAGNRTVLARAITLVESNAPRHAPLADAVVRALLPHAGRSIRVGITGVPGVGKSTFIEALGLKLCGEGRRVAVLAVDPSSTLSRGSILGDKTRMEELGRHPSAFIRPSPSGGALGGVARKTRETVLLCEAAGFDTILVETVGVGQSETTVRSMVDFFLVLMLAGAGDELQGIKKGIIELADALVVTKADGDNVTRAERARAELDRALHVLSPVTRGWRPVAMTCSAVEGSGLAAVWETIERYRKTGLADGWFAARRASQAVDWVHALVEESLLAAFHAHPAVRAALPDYERRVAAQEMSPAAAARHLLQLFNHSTP